MVAQQLFRAARYLHDRDVVHADMKLDNVMSAISSLTSVLQGVAQKVENFDHAQEAICQRLDFAQQAQLQTLNSSQVMLHKVQGHSA